MAFTPPPTNPDLDRLKVTLLKSGLQQKDQPLYQVINTLIDYLRKTFGNLESDIAATSGSIAAITHPSWDVLTDGDLVNPELIFADGEVIMVKTLS
jgi:hypothetical protein